MRTRTALALAAAVLGTGLAVTPPAGAVADTPAAAAPVAAAVSCAGTTDRVRGDHFWSYPTTVNNSGNINCLLGLQNQGAAVRQLQRALRLCYGQEPVAVDGIFGQITRRAVMNVQRFHGITVDGVFGPQTNLVMAWPKYDYFTGAFRGCWF